ncbi:MAG: GNAT family N-acetyltransferase [Bdellovibrionaceae bacterium]|nr:GNAT family N-acetyltransferase [Pseudobdellovibrionaceae bacterium]
MLNIFDQELQSGDIQNWLATMDVDELGLNGWTTSALMTVYYDYPHLLLYASDNTLSSVLMYQKLDETLYEVLFLATAPQFRRRGHSLKLLAAFSASNSGKIWLECRADNDAALNLYAKYGFQITGQRVHYYNDGMDAILMEFSGNLEGEDSAQSTPKK